MSASTKTIGNVSPSWLKSIYNGSCPRQLAATMILKSHTKDITSDAIDKGIRFEYLCIGTANEGKSYNGTQPLTTATGKASADEQHAQKAAQIYRNFETKYGIKYIKKQPVLHFGTTKVIPDYIGQCSEFGTFAADLKFSAMLGNKWEKGGWHDAKFQRNQYTNTFDDYTNLFAPVLAFWLSDYINEPIDNYLYIVASNTDFKVFCITRPTYEAIKDEILQVYDEYKTTYYKPVVEANDWNVAPTKASIKNCVDCPLQDVCSDFCNTPEISKF